MPVVLHHRVRYHETDAQGFLFNSRFLEIADVGLTEFVRAAGWPYPRLLAAGVDPSVVRAAVEFTSPARFEDVLAVDVACTHVGRSSFRMLTRVTRENTAIAEMDLTYVAVDPVAATARPLPADVADALRSSHIAPSISGDSE
jgi:acyl-CoA thioester hydrolase